MPYAVTHILVPLIALDVVRDNWIKHRHAWTNKYLFAAGVGGVLPDAINVLTLITGEFYRPWTHNIFFLAIFLAAAEILRRNKSEHKYALALSFGIATHLMLDALILGGINPIFPVSGEIFAIGLFDIIPLGARGLLGMDVAVFLLWLLHEEKKHKISGFF